MAKLKRGKLSAEETSLIISAYGNGTRVETIAKALNRSEKSIQKFVDEGIATEKQEETIPLVPITKDPTTIPDPPAPLPSGYARKHFEVPDSKRPGEKRRGMAIMTEAGSEAGDKFLKEDMDNLLPMSSKHKNCITKAQND